MKRDADAFSVKLLAATSVCGNRDDVILIRQARVRSILRDRQRSHTVLRTIAGIGVFSVSICVATVAAVAAANAVPFYVALAGGSYLSARVAWGGKTNYSVLMDGLD